MRRKKFFLRFLIPAWIIFCCWGLFLKGRVSAKMITLKFIKTECARALVCVCMYVCMYLWVCVSLQDAYDIRTQSALFSFVLCHNRSFSTLSLPYYALDVRLRIHWLKKDKTSLHSKRGCPGYEGKLHLIVRLQFDIVAYTFIAINPSSTLTWSGCTSQGPIYRSNRSAYKLFVFDRSYKIIEEGLRE